jgi:hypothetical protein
MPQSIRYPMRKYTRYCGLRDVQRMVLNAMYRAERGKRFSINKKIWHILPIADQQYIEDVANDCKLTLKFY